MEIEDAIDEADANDHPIPPHWERRLTAARDIERAVLAFVEDLKYPVNAQGHVYLMGYLPDLPATLSYHFVRRGWRRHDDLAMVKPRRVIGGVFEDLVAYVPIDAPVDPIVVPQNPAPNPDPQLWSVTPVVTESFEERPSDD